MSAALIDLSELLPDPLTCSRAAFETLDEHEIVALLRARFGVLSASGWDDATALLLAVDVERSAIEAAAFAPFASTPLVVQ